MSGNQDTDEGTGRLADTARLPVDGLSGVTDMDGTGGSELVTQFLAELRQFGDQPAPPPSEELAALLGGATPIRFGGGSGRGRPSSRARHRRNAFVMATVSVAALSATGVAAANDSLPQPAQRVVTNVVNDLTPFHIDTEPIVPSRAVIVPAPTTSHAPEPAESESSHSTAPEPEGSHSSAPGGNPGDGHSDGETEGGTGSGPHESDSAGTSSTAGTSGGSHDSGDTSEPEHTSPSSSPDGEHTGDSEQSHLEH